MCLPVSIDFILSFRSRMSVEHPMSCLNEGCQYFNLIFNPQSLLKCSAYIDALLIFEEPSRLHVQGSLIVIHFSFPHNLILGRLRLAEPQPVNVGLRRRRRSLATSSTFHADSVLPQRPRSLGRHSGAQRSRWFVIQGRYKCRLTVTST